MAAGTRVTNDHEMLHVLLTVAKNNVAGCYYKSHVIIYYYMRTKMNRFQLPGTERCRYHAPHTDYTEDAE